MTDQPIPPRLQAVIDAARKGGVHLDFGAWPQERVTGISWCPADAGALAQPNRLAQSIAEHCRGPLPLTIGGLAFMVMPVADYDGLITIRGEDVTAGAGPDATCSCGEPITWYEEGWMHIFNEELRGTGDHEPRPSPYWEPGDEAREGSTS